MPNYPADKTGSREVGPVHASITYNLYQNALLNHTINYARELYITHCRAICTREMDGRPRRVLHGCSQWEACFRLMNILLQAHHSVHFDINTVIAFPFTKNTALGSRNLTNETFFKNPLSYTCFFNFDRNLNSGYSIKLCEI